MSKNKLRVSLSLLLVCLITACANLSTSAIQEPDETTPKARVRVLSNRWLAVFGTAGQNCQRMFRIGERTIIRAGMGVNPGFLGRSLNMPNPEHIGQRKFAEFYVEAGKPFVVRAVQSFHNPTLGQYSSCGVAGTFTPVAGMDYEINSESKNSKCMISLTVLTESGEWKPLPLTKAGKCN
jgi:hypothetical protein